MLQGLENLLALKNSPMEKNDDKALEQSYSTLKYQRKRYYVGWSFKENVANLNDNCWLCYLGLQSTIKTSEKKKEFLSNYDQILKN